jgi:hypothetical protein
MARGTASASGRQNIRQRAARHRCRIEIKAANEVSDPIVQAKAREAAKWVGYANAHAAETHGKEWRYMLVPHNAVGPSATLVGLVARYQTHSQRAVTAV